MPSHDTLSDLVRDLDAHPALVLLVSFPAHTKTIKQRLRANDRSPLARGKPEARARRAIWRDVVVMLTREHLSRIGGGPCQGWETEVFRRPAGLLQATPVVVWGVRAESALNCAERRPGRGAVVMCWEFSVVVIAMLMTF